jgi:hypothetical protein
MAKLTKCLNELTPKKFHEIDTLGLYYKTFYSRNLQIFVMSKMFVPGKPSLMFVDKARGLP